MRGLEVEELWGLDAQLLQDLEFVPFTLSLQVGVGIDRSRLTDRSLRSSSCSNGSGMATRKRWTASWRSRQVHTISREPSLLSFNSA